MNKKDEGRNAGSGVKADGCKKLYGGGGRKIENPRKEKRKSGGSIRRKNSYVY